MSSLKELADEYLRNAADMERRIHQLEEQLKHVKRLEARRKLRRRINTLHVMVCESRKTAFHLEHYYDKPEEVDDGNKQQPKRKRGRPKIDADFTEQLVTSRRAQLNAKYMFDGMVLVKNSPEITEPDMLWKEDAASSSATSKNGILEQLGRMVEQDHPHHNDCIFFAN